MMQSPMKKKENILRDLELLKGGYFFKEVF